MTSSVATIVLSKIGALVSGSRTPADAQQGPQEMLSASTGSRLAALCDEHNDLDIAISVLLDAGNRDDLLITRLKKRKLQIKDEIASIAPWPMVSRVA